MRKRLTRVAAAVAASILLAGASRPVGADPPTEWEVKAAYLYNFTRFIEWPEGPQVSPETPFVVGILGADRFGRVIDETLAGKTVSGRPIVIRRLDRPEDAASVQILFLSSPTDRDLSRALRSTLGNHVLTVGDSEGLARRGVILNFRVQENRVRFEVNLTTADEARLKISSQLLKLAVAVEGK